MKDREKVFYISISHHISDFKSKQLDTPGRAVYTGNIANIWQIITIAIL